MEHFIQSLTMFTAALGAVITALNKIDLTKLKMIPRTDGEIKDIRHILTDMKVDLTKVSTRMDTIESLIHVDHNTSSPPPHHHPDSHT